MDSNRNKKKIVDFFQQKWAPICISILFIIGFLLRLFVIFRIPNEANDAFGYMEIAEYIIGVDGTTYLIPREPLFPFLLGLIYLIFPNTYLTARLFTTILGSVNIVLIYFVAKKYAQKLGADENSNKFGFVSALFVCFNDRLIFTDSWAVREPLYSFLFLILLYSILIERKTLKKIIYCICSFLSWFQ